MDTYKFMNAINKTCLYKFWNSIEMIGYIQGVHYLHPNENMEY